MLAARASQAAVILGNDTIVAARPFSPFQLANACRAAGFDMVVPPSWGDELIATEYLERLAVCRDAVAIACNCERVRRLLPAIASHAGQCGVATAAPPIAAARYLRLTYGESILVTYVGDCPSADDATIDARFSPSGFFASLERQGIAIGSQPDVLPEGESARWQRHRSMPGGLPARRWLARPPVDRVLREVDSQGVAPYRFPSSLRSKVLLDLAETSACACGGNRAVIEEGETARSATPILVAPPGLDLTDAPSLSRAGVSAHASKVRAEREEGHRTQAVRDIGAATASPIEGPQPAPIDEVVTEPTPDVLDPAPLASAVASAELPVTPVEPITPVVQPPLAVALPAQPARSPKWEARRVAQAAADRRQRTIALIAVPAIVLTVIAALGVGAYTFAARSRAQATAASGESSSPATASQPGSSPDSSQAQVAPRIDSVSASGSIPSADTARASVDSTHRADSVAVDSALAPLDSAAQAAALRRARRAVEVVPGWMPQGQKSWTPADSIRPRKPDSTKTTRPKPDTLPPA